VWNGQGELVYIGQKSATGCRLALEGKGPGPEVFIADNLEQGPFTMKVLFFAGRHREVQGKLRVIRTTPEATRDDTYGFTLRMRREVVEIGVF